MSATTPTTVVSSASDPSQPTTRPSIAIQEGADLLVELIQHEKSKLTKLYSDALRKIEAGVKDSQAKTDFRLQGAEGRIKTQEKQIEELSVDLQRARSKTTIAEVELEKLRAEHESLKASLGCVGLVYADGSLGFNEETKRVVGDFMKGARIQQKALMSSRLSSSHSLPSSEDDRFSRPVGPTEFFGVLSGVMERGRKFAEELEKRSRRERGIVENETSEPSTIEVSAQNQAVLKPISENHRSDLTARSSSETLDIFSYQLNRYLQLTEPSKRPAPFVPPSNPPTKQQRTI